MYKELSESSAVRLASAQKSQGESIHTIIKQLIIKVQNDGTN